MKHWIKRFSLVVALVTVSGFSSAQEADLTGARNKLETQLGLQVSEIKPSPVAGLFEAFTDRGLFYVSNDGKFLVQGRVYNIDERMRNETEESLSSIRLDGIGEFDNSMIEFKAEDEKFAVTVFTDITCGYCRKLHNEMQAYNDLGITVRYLAFPRGGLQSQSYNDMVSVWCDKDPQDALTKAKNGDSFRKGSTCDREQVAKQYEFGRQIGVTGTPAIVLQNGSMVPGYQPPGQLMQTIQSIR
ncbi:bifunctional protein-disulfide isomerase/oxidoreductase DsbC [Alteromonadaceae bacterium M269]|nr:bifunctional protein-disulfide isomerase/oxidoreductase DsbC [Alteromonadaceae bacterium M269]